MATITLSADTLFSSLMPSGGGSLASGDTIQLAGHSLIVDADAVDYPVTIANSGADANLELRDLSRIKLNATLPANVHPWIDPAHPLPVSAEPGIAGDPYRTNLTANARAEIQLNGNFGLGGGTASLPTETRNGAFWGKVQSATSYTITFDRDFPLHVGDMIQNLSDYRAIQKLTVTAYDSSEHIATLSGEPARKEADDWWALVAGGVLVNRVTSGSNTILNNDVGGGTLVIIEKNTETAPDVAFFGGVNMECERLLVAPTTTAASNSYFLVRSGETSVRNIHCAQLSVPKLFSSNNNGTKQIIVACLHVDEICSSYLCNQADNGSLYLFIGDFYIGRGIAGAKTFSAFHVFGKYQFAFCKTEMLAWPNLNGFGSAMHFDDCTIAGESTGNLFLSSAGIVTESNNQWYHAPATAADVTWRYTDRTVPPGATLRLRCAWLREGSTETRASIAVTDPATWWPQLWPLGAEALASVEFTGGTADSRTELLTWRNTGTEAATVRVWECVTGTVAGGYLRTIEATGGAL